MSEAGDHPHLVARGIFVERDGITPAGAGAAVQPDARCRGDAARPRPGADTREALAAWGVADVDALLESGAAVQA